MNGKKKHVHRWEDNVVKMPVVSKLTYRFNAIPIKIRAGDFFFFKKLTNIF